MQTSDETLSWYIIKYQSPVNFNHEAEIAFNYAAYVQSTP